VDREGSLRNANDQFQRGADFDGSDCKGSDFEEPGILIWAGELFFCS